MNLRSFFPHRHAHEVPLLPTIEADDHHPQRPGRTTRHRTARDEHLERLLTPSERDLVEHKRI